MSARGWDKPYPVFVLTGTDDFMRERELWKARRAAGRTNRRWVRLSEGDSAGLASLLAASDFFEDRTMVVLLADGGGRKKGQGWTDADIALLTRHHQDNAKVTEVDTAIVVVSHSAPPAKDAPGFVGQMVALVGKGRHLTWEAPKPWQEREVAAKFLQAEVARLGATMPEDLALLMVKTCGADRWLVSTEALKLVTLLAAEGRAGGVVTRADVQGVVAPLAGGAIEDLMSGVAAGSAVMVSKSVSALAADGDGPPIAACAAVASAVTRWLHAASALRTEGVTEDEVASRLGVSPYSFKQNILPHAKRWGVRNLTALLRDVAFVERASKQGRVSPWISLETALLRHCARLA